MLDWMIDNNEWIFSGVGVAVLTMIFGFIAVRKRNAAMADKSQSVTGIKASGNVTIKQTIGSSDEISIQVHKTLMVLRKMPGRIQDKINAGETHIETTEALHELEKLFVLASAKQDSNLLKSMMQVQNRYNNYLSLLNKATSKEVTLSDVNQFHRIELVGWFEENVAQKYKI